jgi:hypothetical protein
MRTGASISGRNTGTNALAASLPLAVVGFGAFVVASFGCWTVGHLAASTLGATRISAESILWSLRFGGPAGGEDV